MKLTCSIGKKNFFFLFEFEFEVSEKKIGGNRGDLKKF